MRKQRSWQLAAVSKQLAVISRQLAVTANCTLSIANSSCKLRTPVIDPRPTIYAVWLLAAALAGCGVETATTAATSAAIKKEEIEQGKKTMSQAQQKVEQAARQMQERAQRDSEAAGR